MKISEINFNNVLLGHVAGAPVQHKKSGLPQIAFSGRSNVGKSSLINSLLNRKSLARVSSQPGKTITCNWLVSVEVRGKHEPSTFTGSMMLFGSLTCRDTALQNVPRRTKSAGRH